MFKILPWISGFLGCNVSLSMKLKFLNAQQNFRNLTILGIAKLGQISFKILVKIFSMLQINWMSEI